MYDCTICVQAGTRLLYRYHIVTSIYRSAFYITSSLTEMRLNGIVVTCERQLGYVHEDGMRVLTLDEAWLRA